MGVADSLPRANQKTKIRRIAVQLQFSPHTHARCRSILDRVDKDESDNVSYALTNDYALDIIKVLSRYEGIILQASENYEPSIIAKYIFNLAQLFNKYYGNVRILEDDDEKASRIKLVESVAIVLKDGLRLLGIKAPDQM